MGKEWKASNLMAASSSEGVYAFDFVGQVAPLNQISRFMDTWSKTKLDGFVFLLPS